MKTNVLETNATLATTHQRRDFHIHSQSTYLFCIAYDFFFFFIFFSYNRATHKVK